MEYKIEEKANGKFIVKVRTGLFSWSSLGFHYNSLHLPTEFDSINDASAAIDKDHSSRTKSNKIVAIITKD